MSRINCLIVDDEPVAREGIKMFVDQIDFLNLIGMCENPIEANAILQKEKIDLIFLDIQMPKLTGLDFLKMLKDPPMVILITAYPNFALEGYAMDVIDYLVKPVALERFVKAANKAHDYFQLLTQNVLNDSKTIDYIFVKCDNQYEKILLDEILYIEGMQNYVKIFTSGKRFVTYSSMKSLEENLPSDQFLRVHKSFLVAKAKVDSVRGNELLIGEAHIPISRKHKSEILAKIMGDNLIN